MGEKDTVMFIYSFGWISHMADTVLGGAIEFMAQLGVYDIILPFLLVFALMFATLEKTKVLGVETIVSPKTGKEHTYTRKNLNSIVAFTTAFFVIASAQLVRIISEVIANTMILLVTGLCFMLTVGLSHSGTGEFSLSKHKGWEIGFWVVNAVGILLIFLNAIGWLDKIYQFFLRGIRSPQTVTIIMILLFVGIMWWITKSPKRASSDSD